MVKGREVRDLLLPVLSGANRRLYARVIRSLLLCLTHAYSAALHAHMGLYEVGLLRRVKLPCPVISVGNLTVGGTGKTSMVLMLARELHRRGLRPVVLAHGYGAASSQAVVVSDGGAVLLPPYAAGDEAFLLASSLAGVPVVAGRKRAASGALALGFSPGVLVLDDGFQHWRLARDLDVVLLDAAEPFGFGYLLPRGLLREPPSHLRRAGAVVITRCNMVSSDRLRAVEREVERWAPGVPIWRAWYEPVGMTRLDDGSSVDLWDVRGKRVAALSSIAAPEAFEGMLRAMGASKVIPIRYPDHHLYTPEDLVEIAGKVLSANAEMLVTTEKDAVKVRALASGLPGSAVEAVRKARVLSVRMIVDDKERFLEFVVSFACTGMRS
ncbi:MAG: tetraacyldisaccharide 4'-kinase [Armatimonadota bacterium]